MKKYIKFGIIFFVCAAAVGILWSQSHRKKDVLGEKQITNTAEKISFPKTYEQQVSDTFSIEANVIVPEEFDLNQLYKAEAHIIEPDVEKWKNRFLESGQDYTEKDYEDVSREQKSIVCKGYEKKGDRDLYLSEQCASIYFDTYTFINNCLVWDYPTSEGYNRNMYATEGNLEFFDRKNVWTSVTEELESLGIPMENAVLEKGYNLDYETLKQQEELAVQRGDLEEEEKKSSWNREDDTYYYYIWQYYQGLPVYPDAYVEDVDAENMVGGMECCYGKNGFQFLSVSYWMEFKKTADKITLLPFENVMQTVIKKYGQVINDNPMKLTACRLFEAPILKEENTYEVIPVWICKIEIENESYNICMPINAVTGEEVEEMGWE